MITNQDFQKHDVFFRLGIPNRRNTYTGPYYSLEQILQIIESNDPSFPLQSYNHSNNKWVISDGCYDKTHKAFYWSKAVFSLDGFTRLMYQAGWFVPVYHWEIVPAKNRPTDTDIDTISTGVIQVDRDVSNNSVN